MAPGPSRVYPVPPAGGSSDSDQAAGSGAASALSGSSVAAGVADPPRPRIASTTISAITMSAITIPRIAQSRVERPDEELGPELVNVTVTPASAPVNVTGPLDGDAEYPLTEPIWYQYVPFASWKVRVVVVEVCVVVPIVTDQLVPVGNPLSVKVSAYVTGAATKVTASGTADPATWTAPLACSIVYPLIGLITKSYVPFVSRKVTVLVLLEYAVVVPKVTDQFVPGRVRFP